MDSWRILMHGTCAIWQCRPVYRGFIVGSVGSRPNRQKFLYLHSCVFITPSPPSPYVVRSMNLNCDLRSSLLRRDPLSKRSRTSFRRERSCHEEKHRRWRIWISKGCSIQATGTSYLSRKLSEIHLFTIFSLIPKIFCHFYSHEVVDKLLWSFWIFFFFLKRSLQIYVGDTFCRIRRGTIFIFRSSCFRMMLILLIFILKVGQVHF